MDDFRFASPAYLLLLGALPLLLLVLAKVHTNAREKLLRFVAEANLSHLLKVRGEKTGPWKRSFFWIGLSLMILALARPQGNPVVEEMEGASLDIYVLLDVSSSMNAEDIPPSRLQKAKRSIQSLMSLLSGDRVGVIAFAGTAVMISPLTADYEVIQTFLQHTDSSVIQRQGTEIGKALEMADEAMARGAEKTGASSMRSNVFIVMSDGEDHSQATWNAADRIREKGGVIFTIAYGTERGASIPVRNHRGELSGHKRDRQGNQVVTAVNPESLREIARRGGGQFYFATMEEEEIRDILNRVQGLDRSAATLMRARIYQEYFVPVLALGVLFVILSFVSLSHLLKRRKPWAAALLVLIPSPAFATSLLWNAEKRAFTTSQELAQEGKHEEAAGQLKGLLAEDPDRPELNYNIGTYLAEGKKGEEARKQLERLLDPANPLREMALFNIAGSFAQEGKKPEARAAYGELLRSLREQGSLNDNQKRLAEMARRNLARLADEQQNQQQQQQQSGGQQGQDKKQQDQGEGDPQENSGQGKEDQKDQKPQDQNQDGQSGDKDEPKESEGQNQEREGPSEGEEEQDRQMQPGRKPFRERDNMSEDDAKRILEALSQREGNLQRNFLKQREENKGYDESGKDW